MLRIILGILLCFGALFAQFDIGSLSPEQLAKYKELVEKSKSASAKVVKNEKEEDEIRNEIEFEDLIETTKENNVTEAQKTQIKKDKDNEEEIVKNPFVYKMNEEIIKKIQKDKIKNEQKQLQRFGSNFFKNKNKINPYAVPTPDYYVLNSGDVISIHIYGIQNSSYELSLDRNGNIDFPGIGLLKIGGLKYSEAKKVINAAVLKAFPDSEIIVDIVKYSAIQVTITGNVKYPGLYNLASFSTIKDALIASRGIDDIGSMRDIVLKRAGKDIGTFDLYKLIKYGKDTPDMLLRSGDIIFVPKAKKLVSISGEITIPGIYELKKGEGFDDLLEYASDLTFNASKYGIKLTRFDDNKNIKIFTLSKDELFEKKPLKGDFVEIFSLSKLNKKMVQIYGNIVNEGEREIPKDALLNTLLKKEISFFGIDGFFLDNTLFDLAMIKRKSAKDGYVLETFSIKEVLANSKKIKLQDRDEIYIFNKLQLKENPYIYVKGKVVKEEGKYQYYKNMTLGNLFDIVEFRSEIIEDENLTTSFQSNKNDVSSFQNEFEDKKRIMLQVDKTNIKITRFDNDKKKIYILDLKTKGDFKLKPFDEIEFFDYYDTHPRLTAQIIGEVYRPGNYEIRENTTLKELLKIAGGLTKKAFIDEVEITRYYIADNERKRKIISLNLNETFNDEFIIEDGDEISVRAIPKWGEKKYVFLKGQVKFPGRYSIEDGDTIYDVLKRAGGFVENAFIEGAVFTRKSVKKLQKEELEKSLRDLKAQAAYTAASATEAGEKAEDKKRLLIMVEQIAKQAKEVEPIGRVSIELTSNLESFKKSDFNIPLEDGDVLYIPTVNKTVTVIGEVLNPNTFIYKKDISVTKYIEKSGGLKESADEDNIYVVKANGEAKRFKRGYFYNSNGFIEMGDTIIVPKKIITTSGIALAKDIADITYKLAITAASLKTVGGI